MWPLTDEAVAAKVAGLMGPKPVFIADGHHRYETACNYRDEVAAANGGSLPSDHPANFVLMMLVGMSDPGLVVLPTHRLFVEPSVATAADLAAKLGDSFTTETAGKGPSAAADVWEQIETEDAHRRVRPGWSRSRPTTAPPGGAWVSRSSTGS
jgi:uncharacterized protein (DUF1015 family)